jgi:hypothetical protein
MTKKKVGISLTSAHHAKLKAIAKIKGKTVTRLVEDWIERQKTPISSPQKSSSAGNPQIESMENLVRICVARLVDVDSWEDVEKLTSRWDAEFKAKVWEQLGENERSRIQSLKEEF